MPQRGKAVAVVAIVILIAMVIMVIAVARILIYDNAMNHLPTI